MNESFPNESNGQINPGEAGQKGEEVTIRKNESISDQGNEWTDQEGIHAGSKGVLGEKAEKYIQDSADIEDLPDEEDETEARRAEEQRNKEKNSNVVGDQTEEDEVVERREDFVPGYDLGRNKVQ